MRFQLLCSSNPDGAHVHCTVGRVQALRVLRDQSPHTRASLLQDLKRTASRRGGQCAGEAVLAVALAVCAILIFFGVFLVAAQCPAVLLVRTCWQTLSSSIALWWRWRW